MNRLQNKMRLGTCATALSLLLATPSVHAAAPQVTYNETKVNFAPAFRMKLTYNSLAHDSQGNVFLLGTAQGVGIDFDPGPGVDHKGTLYTSTAFITKQNANGSYGGTRLITSKRYWTSGYVAAAEGLFSGVSIKVDANDNLYILGKNPEGPDIEVKRVVDLLVSGNLGIPQTYSVTRAPFDLDPLTNNLNSSTHDSIARDNYGDYGITSRGGRLFVTKINAQGSQVWSRVIGYDTGGLSLSSEPLAVKPDGSVYIAGSFTGTLDFDPTTGSDVRSSTNTSGLYPHINKDAFITRLAADGGYVDTKTSGKFYDPLLVSTTGGNLYLSGQIKSLTDFDPTNTFSRNFDASIASINAVFTTKLDANFSPVWTRTYTYPASSIPVAQDVNHTAINIAVGEADTFYITYGNYLTKVRGDGVTMWTRIVGAVVEGLAVDKANNPYVTGFYGHDAVDFDQSSSGSDVRTLHGLRDIYITAFDSNGNYGWTKTIGGAATDAGDNIMAAGQTLYVTGTFGGQNFQYPWITYVPGGPVPVDFNPEAGYDYQTPSPNGNPSVFLSKYDISSPTTITVTARGSHAGGVYPTMIVRVDGQVAGTFNVTATNAPYVVSVNAAQGASHVIDVVFTNDAVMTSATGVREDRNLYVQSLRVNSTTILPNSAAVTYDRGAGNRAFDGLSVIAGQIYMWWSGALRFTVPAAAF